MIRRELRHKGGTKLESIEYKCPNCNADLKFNPDTQKLDCEFCMSSFTIDEVKNACAEAENSIPDEVLEEERQEFEEHTNLYHCKSCGAEIMADDQQTALFCYYCHNPVILSGKMGGKYRPSKVIGFKLNRDKAVKLFKSWVAKRRFVPDDFKSEQQVEKITGLYVPFWVADCKIKANYHATGKKIRSWSTGNYRYTETKEFRVDRCADVVMQGIPADGETKIDDLLMESIEPYDYKELQPFSMSYLSGFFADKYDVDEAGVFPRIRDRATAASRKVITDSVTGYNSVVVMSEHYDILKTDWSYIMLPVWFMTYRYNDQIYEFAINGQTGKLAGTPPLNKKKLFRFCTILGAGLSVAFYLLGGAML